MVPGNCPIVCDVCATCHRDQSLNQVSVASPLLYMNMVNCGIQQYSL